MINKGNKGKQLKTKQSKQKNNVIYKSPRKESSEENGKKENYQRNNQHFPKLKGMGSLQKAHFYPSTVAEKKKSNLREI